MQIAKLDRDRLTELINIGYGRAAGSLSKLVGKRIILRAPTVELHAINNLSQALVKLVGKEVSSVRQVFSGAVGGHALLLLDRHSADVLTALLLKDANVEDCKSAEREALIEMGNIVLQSAIGICGNMLKLQVAFSVPNVSLEAIDDLLNSIVVGDTELKFALLIDTRFQVADQEVSGYLAVVLGLTSYSLLLAELDKWEGRQVWP
jgi:chemotaxis protein CheC